MPQTLESRQVVANFYGGTMKKTVWTFGLIAGAIMSILMAANMAVIDEFGFEKGEILGYTTMVVGFLLIFFGIRSYRDNVGRGSISFGRGVAVGLLITAISGIIYVASWEVLYRTAMSDFIPKYQAHLMDKARAEGKTDAELLQLQAKNERDARHYANPVFRAAFTFLEPLPVGLIVSLVSAGILSRRRKGDHRGLAPA